MRRLLPILAALLIIAAAAGGIWYQTRARQPNVIFIVLDTVRADHLSLCGYERPTTPTLEALASRADAQVICDGWAPASWTLPSHASYFTGAFPEVHHSHAITSGVDDYSGGQARTRKLDKALPTLAEKLRDRGYQTLAVSANPVVSRKLGLLRGFEASRVSSAWGEMFDEDLLENFDALLDNQYTPGKPLLLFVNIADAHQGWEPVPEGALGGAVTRPVRRIKYNKLSEHSRWRRLVGGTMPDDERAEWLQELNDGYDYGIWRADRNLAAVMARIEARGLCEPDCRIIITSDHGEFLGEHNLLDHGYYTWEGMIRVPLLALGWDGVPELSAPMSTLAAHSLALDGTLPDTPLPLQSAAWPHVRRCALTKGLAFCPVSATVRDGDTKLLWMDGEVSRYDLAADVAEESPLPVDTADPLYARLMALAEAVDADTRDDSEEDLDVIEALRAAGYLE